MSAAKAGSEGVEDGGWKPESGSTRIRDSVMFSPIRASEEAGAPRRRILPRRGYAIASDYVRLDDDTWMSMLDFVHDDGVAESWNTFWPLARIPRIPMEKTDRVEVALIDAIGRKSPTWVDHHLRSAGGAVDMAQGEVESKHSTTGDTTAHRVRRSVSDLDVITREIQGKAAYVQVDMRMIVKANSLDALDRAIRAINRQLDDRFETLRVIAPDGEQEQRMRDSLGVMPDEMGGRSVYFTSTEFGGAYELMTHGLRDPGGEYVGQMYGDYNNSTVLIDFERNQGDTVVAMTGLAGETPEWLRRHPGERVHHMNLGHLWGVKMAQSAVLHGHRAVVFGLEPEVDVSMIGMPLRRLTARVDMEDPRHGGVNMFEMFDPPLDDLPQDATPEQRRRKRLERLPAVYSAQVGKLSAMTRMLAGPDEASTITDATLTRVLKDFYEGQRMIVPNMAANLERLRMTRVPHGEVPRLSMFVNYLGTALDDRRRDRSNNDPEDMHAYNFLHSMFSNVLEKDGSLFDVATSDDVDRVRGSARVIYDLSRVLGRGLPVAMAELVNVFDYAVGGLRMGDLVVLHGVETLSDEAKAYIAAKQRVLRGRGVRTAYIYSTGPDAALADSGFNRLDSAGMTVFGRMTESNVKAYEELQGQAMPQDLKGDIMGGQAPGLCYVHRGIDNVLFFQDLLLGHSIGRSERRAAILGRDDVRTFDVAAPD